MSSFQSFIPVPLHNLSFEKLKVSRPDLVDFLNDAIKINTVLVFVIIMQFIASVTALKYRYFVYLVIFINIGLAFYHFVVTKLIKIEN